MKHIVSILLCAAMTASQPASAAILREVTKTLDGYKKADRQIETSGIEPEQVHCHRRICREVSAWLVCGKHKSSDREGSLLLVGSLKGYRRFADSSTVPGA